MVKYVVFCVMIIAGYLVYANFPVSHGPGIMAEHPPKIKTAGWQKPFEFNSATITPQKRVEATVRIIEKKTYYFDDFSSYSPIDALVGWNQLSDERNLDFIYPRLYERSYEIDLTRPPLEIASIYQETDLWHFIPSSANIKEQLSQLRDGHIITLKGLLVDIETNGTFRFNTETELSKNRNSKGFGIWVEEFRIH